MVVIGELVSGAVVGAAIGELLKAVLVAKDQVINFKTIFQRLESKLQLMIPRVNRICSLNQELNRPEDQLKDFITILKGGEQLVHKCLKVSSLNIVKKRQYSKQLLDLDSSLSSYLQTIAVLDQAGDIKELLVLMKKMCTFLMESHMNEEIVSQIQVTTVCIESNLLMRDNRDVLMRDNRDENTENQATFSVPTESSSIVPKEDANQIELSSKDESIVPIKENTSQRNEGQAELYSQDSEINRRNKEARTFNKQKIAMKMSISCDKCRTKAMKIAVVVSGVISVAIEGGEKNVMVVIGDGVDTVGLVCSLRKKVGHTDLLSIAEAIDCQALNP